MSQSPFVSIPIPIPIHWLFENYFIHLNWYFLDLSLNQLLFTLSKFCSLEVLKSLLFQCLSIDFKSILIFALLLTLLPGPVRGSMSPIPFSDACSDFWFYELMYDALNASTLQPKPIVSLWIFAIFIHHQVFCLFSCL